MVIASKAKSTNKDGSLKKGFKKQVVTIRGKKRDMYTDMRDKKVRAKSKEMNMKKKEKKKQKLLDKLVTKKASECPCDNEGECSK